MKIERIAIDSLPVPLKRPYRIANQTTESVRIAFVRIEGENGVTGYGSATPEPDITGESFEACVEALERGASRLVRTTRDVREHIRALEPLSPATPGARAALDMALFDLWARLAGRPLVDLLGRVHRELPTSITIGIMAVDETLEEADEYVARGFRALKVKIGESFEADMERMTRLREHVGPSIALRADANVGYEPASIVRCYEHLHALDVEVLEQPSPPERDADLRVLAVPVRRWLMADESLHDESDALDLGHEPRPYGVWNVKLMKCGGIAPALRIAHIAAQHGVDLMWGCMDESEIGIAAALHAAFACSATRYLDLDGSFDLARDPARGGFELVDGCLRTSNRPGLGVEVML